MGGFIVVLPGRDDEDVNEAVQHRQQDDGGCNGALTLVKPIQINRTEQG